MVACDEVETLALETLEPSKALEGGGGGEGSTSCVFIVLFHFGWPIEGTSDGAGGSYSSLWPGVFIGMLAGVFDWNWRHGMAWHGGQSIAEL